MRGKCIKNNRMLDLYVRFCEGQILRKKEEAKRFGVDERSIQRDIDDIRDFLKNRAALEQTERRTIIYDRKRKGFVMTGAEAAFMTNGEILAASKILLASRAFTKKEITMILDKMVAGCVPQQSIKLVQELLSNEKVHYVEPQHKSSIQEKLWEIEDGVQSHSLMEINYARGNEEKIIINRRIEPVALMFSEFYFYLHAFTVELDKSGHYVHQHDFPTVFRVDRIQEYRYLEKKMDIAYAKSFVEGELRKRVQFQYPGKLMTLRLRVYGTAEAILDRLPTAQVTESYGGSCIVEAEIYSGRGVILWLLSQGGKVEVLRPVSLRLDMKKVLQEILEYYEGEK